MSGNLLKLGMLLRLFVSAVAVALVAAPFIGESYQLPFLLRSAPQGGVIDTRPGVALPSGLQTGDRVLWQQQPRRTRALLIGTENVPATQSFTLRVQRSGLMLAVEVHTIPRSLPGSTLMGAVRVIVYVALLSLILLTLWRGRGVIAWGLTLFAFAKLAAYTLPWISLPVYGSIGVDLLARNLETGVAMFGLYVTAVTLTRAPEPRGRARSMVRHIPFIALVLASAIVSTARPLAFVAGYTSLYSFGLLLRKPLVFSVYVAPLLVFLLGYARAASDARLRIRWILVGAALVPLLVLPISVPVREIVLVAFPAILTYAVLRQRLVEVRVVLNRTLVFALLMGVIVAFFALMEILAERSTLSQRASLSIEIGVPLALGVLFHHMQRRIEALVDRFFFRREHRAREALESFVHDAGFIESSQTLIERAVASFGQYVSGQGAALYEQDGEGFICVGSNMRAPPPRELGRDDPALVRVRGSLRPLDLHDVGGSSLGPAGLALPLALRGRLFGLLVCGPKIAGRYAQTEIDEIGRAAHEVGASLFALRVQASEAQVRASEARAQTIEAQFKASEARAQASEALALEALRAVGSIAK
jgi:hypothetical protein